MNRIYKVTMWGSVGLTVIMITIASLLPAANFQRTVWSSLWSYDKILHALAYMILMILFVISQRHYPMLEGKNIILLVGVTFAMYSVCLECAQFLSFQGRNFELLDIIANIIGLLFGYLFMRII